MNFDAIIVGLGNPGLRYAFTRHNIGFMALDVLAGDLDFSWTHNGLASKINAETAQGEWDGLKVILIKPQTFMNLSGECIAALYAIHSHLKEVPLVVLHDEVDIPFGKVRVKWGGSDAGHNGLKSIRQQLGHGDYYRVRLGVGKPGDENTIDLASYVLAPFEKSSEQILISEIERGLEATKLLCGKMLLEAQTLASKE